MNNDRRESLITIQHLSVFYGPIQAIKDVSLHVEKGEIVTLIGSNGAGKSTLLKAILNLNTCQGSVLFKGEDISSMPTDMIIASGISIIPEGHVNFTTMTVEENLLIGAYHGRRGDMFQKVYEYFPILERRKDQRAGTLSGGEQQMLSIGRALLAEPELILVDEPSLGLAPKVVNTIFQILQDLNDEGYTILLSEQNVKKSLDISHRGYVLETGSLFLQGSSEELKKSEKIQLAYLGSSLE